MNRILESFANLARLGAQSARAACPLAALLGVLQAAPAVAGPLLISEILYDAVGSDDGLVFVELHGDAGTVLDGYTIEGVNGSGGALGPLLTLAGTIASDGFFVVADTSSGGGTGVLDADQLLNFDFQNGPDSVVLRDPLAAILDALGYGSFGPGDVFAGEGFPAPGPPAGASLARLFADLDTNDNAADFAALANPTPGSGPVLVPEPHAGLLLASGLLSTAFLRRRGARTPQAVA
jgi:hypothetical protein